MAQNSKIEWCDHTDNLWWGCTHVHEGCDNCYAETLAHRFGPNVWGNDAPRRIINSFFSELDKYQRDAAKEDKIARVFVGSMMDIFEKPMPLVDKQGNEVHGQNTGNLRFHFFYRIDRGDYPNLMFLLLTKRPSNINKYIFESWKETPPANVMFGYSPVTQKTFDDGVNQLLMVNGKKFLSVEPQLEEITLSNLLKDATRQVFSGGEEKIVRYPINWIIQGGESGPKKRPFDIAWARKMRDECAEYGVPYFFKQIDKIQSIPEDLHVRQFPS